MVEDFSCCIKLYTAHPEGKKSFRVDKRCRSLPHLHYELSECGFGSLGGPCSCFSSIPWLECDREQFLHYHGAAADQVKACSKIHTGALKSTLELLASFLWAASGSLLIQFNAWFNRVCALLLTGGKLCLGVPVLSGFAISCCYRW